MSASVMRPTSRGPKAPTAAATATTAGTERKLSGASSSAAPAVPVKLRTMRSSSASSAAPPTSSTSTMPAINTASASASAAPKKKSVVSNSSSSLTRSASNSLTSSPTIGTSSVASRRRLSVAETMKEKDEQKTAAPTTTTTTAATNAGASKIAVRRRLSIMNVAGVDSSSAQHIDGLPDPKQSREPKIKSARGPNPNTLTNTSNNATTNKTANATTPSTSVTALPAVNTPLPPVSTVVPRRVFSHYASLSKVGYIPFNPHKVNQDRAVELIKFSGRDDCALFGVFDGHGQLGHEVSSFLVNEIPRQMTRQSNLMHGEHTMQCLNKAFLDTNSTLSHSASIDCTFSGSTAIVCYLHGRKLYTCNVGDSRAVLGRMDGGKVSAIALSVDQKPERPDEKKRILDCRGRVEACKGTRGEDIGPARVWLQHQDVPGLAMTRSFGDLIAASVGVIAKPEISERTLLDSDAFIVLGSDGIFEFLSSEEVCQLVARVAGPHGEKCEEAAKALVDEATKRWNREEEVVDDITAIIVYF